jgi:hypothetical protein
MTYHLCRDYLTNINTNSIPSAYNDGSGLASMYVMAAFLRYVLGYSQVGETNFNLNSSPILVAGSNSNTATVSNSGSISFVNIPSSGSGSYTVSAANDIGRMVVLKSPGHPTTNSGVFLITGVNVGLNQYTVSARIGTGATLVTESGLSWYVLENDALICGGTTTYGFSTLMGTEGTSGNTGYGGNTNKYTTLATGYTFTQSAPPNPISLASTTGFLGVGAVQVIGVPLTIGYTGVSGNTITGTSYATGGNSFSITLPSGSVVAQLINVANATSYAGNGTAIAPRIILQSPHSTGWQVRLAMEPSSFLNNTNIGARYSIAPGFNGNSAGDFPINQPSLHAGLYFNDNPSDLGYLGLTVGPYANGFINGSRITVGGDDTGQAVVLLIRNINNNNILYTWAIFGIPDNEPSPLPPNNIQRLFAISGGDTSYGGNYGIGFTVSAAAACGVGFGLDESICTSGPSLWTQTNNEQLSGTQVSPMFSVNAGDNPFLGATELLPVDIINGVLWGNAGLTSIGGGAEQKVNQQPRTIGTLPLVRAGRANFADWSNTTDSSTNPAWFHAINGVFLQWGGPPVIP